MTEDTSEFVAASEFSHPLLDICVFLPNAARPMPIDQDPRAVIAPGRLVGALDCNHWTVSPAGVGGIGYAAVLALAASTFSHTFQSSTPPRRPRRG